MRRSPNLRPTVWDGLVVCAVVLLAVLCGVMVWGGDGGTDQLTVVVSIDGEEVERCALEEFPDMDRVYTGHGYTLNVTLTEVASSGGWGLRVTESDCPTQDCVHTGAISRGGQSIVCLPARIIIQLEGGAAAHDGPDLVIG